MSLVAVCGGCDRPAGIHPIEETFSTPGCFRFHDTIGYAYWEESGRTIYDYWLDNGNVVIRESFEGPAAKDPKASRNILPDEDDVEYVTANDDLEVVLTSTGKYTTITRWSDQNIHEYTSVRDWSYGHQQKIPYREVFSPKHDSQAVLPTTIRGETYFNREAEARTAYVEGHEGFIAKSFLDLLLTEAYNNHLLNIFTDKFTGDLRVGGMRITSDLTTKEVIATCVTPQHKCDAPPLTLAFDATLDECRWFVYVCIAHGNNHAAPWFIARDSWYKVHHPDCDLTRCDTSVAHCEYHRSPLELKAISFPHDEVVLALSEHVSICKSDTCDCIQALNREVDVVLAA